MQLVRYKSDTSTAPVQVVKPRGGVGGVGGVDVNSYKFNIVFLFFNFSEIVHYLPLFLFKFGRARLAAKRTRYFIWDCMTLRRTENMDAHGLRCLTDVKKV